LKGSKLYYDQFTLGDLIGAGGFAGVYRAQQEGRAEAVAVKLSQQPDANMLITNEAELIQKFDHQHIIKLLPIKRADKSDIYHARAGEVPGNPAFFVMEYLDGGTLAAYLQQVLSLTVLEAATIGLQLARALDHIHSNGFAHNDLKLENILFRYPIKAGERFQIVLVDFGVATKVARPQGITPYISAPEQVGMMNLSQAPELNEGIDRKKVDVWGLGVILYRMLGGQLPFDARSERTLTDRIVYSRPTSLRDLQGNISSYLDDLIIDGCLAKEPSQRLNLLDVGRELRRLLGSSGEVTAQISNKSARQLFKR